MSHTATVSVEIKDKRAFESACKRLKIPCNLDEEVRLYDGTTVRGMTARLPGWKYPAVFADGQAHFDVFSERWGKLSELDKLKQAYSLEAAKRKVSKKYTVREVKGKNGHIRLECVQKGAY